MKATIKLRASSYDAVVEIRATLKRPCRWESADFRRQREDLADSLHKVLTDQFHARQIEFTK